MRTNWVREKLRRGQPTIGCFIGLGSPSVAEMMAHAGFDWLVIETEHNGLDSAEIEHMLMAMNATDAIPIVRIPNASPVYIQRALDMGAMGVIVPMVRTADEARAIVGATRYPPAGARSFGPLRASHYSFDNADYLERANENMLVVLILETKEAIDNLEEIMSVEGIDAVYFGTYDLCLSLGLNPMHQPYPQIDAAFERALTLGRQYNVAIGHGASTPDQLRRNQAQGFTMLGYGPDYALLAQAAREGLAAFQQHPAAAR